MQQQPRNSNARHLANGRWRSILRDFGMAEKYLTGKHTDCPICGDGKDRFRFDDKDGKGSYFCSVCGNGDGFQLLEQWGGVSFREAAAKIEGIAPTMPKEKPRGTISLADAKSMVSRIWRESAPLTEGDDAWRYLQGRGLKPQRLHLKSVRLHPGLDCREGGVLVGRFKALVLVVASPAGEVVTLHRIFLKDGAKAPVEKPKKMLPVPDEITVNGASIRLSAFDEVIGLAEGPETAWACEQMFGMPVWSCISSGGIETWEPPPGGRVRKVVIFADNDANFAGQKAAYVLANRLALRFKLEVEVEVPPNVSSDWADYLQPSDFFLQNQKV